MRFTLFIPIRDEIEGLRVIMPRIDRAWVDEILILDGGSTDGSREYLLSIGHDVVQQTTSGVKAAFWEAFEQATGDVIIPFSPDGNSIPEDIPRLIDQINLGYDIVIASRYLPPASSKDDDFVSGLANYFFTKLINYFFATKVTDGLGMYKAFYKKHLYTLGIHRHKTEHSEYLITARGARSGLKIIEFASGEPGRLGAPGSRAHPGIFGKYKSGALILFGVLRDAIYYWPK